MIQISNTSLTLTWSNENEENKDDRKGYRIVSTEGKSVTGNLDIEDKMQGKSSAIANLSNLEPETTYYTKALNKIPAASTVKFYI